MSTETNKPYILTGAELHDIKVEPSRWLVDGLLRSGRRRISLLAGKPEDGKSTLAKQLAVAVMQGREFLGRSTVRGSVLYWQTEDEPGDVKTAFAALGYDHTKDEQLLIFTGSPNENKLENLRDVLASRPDVRLVIIETLDDLLQLADIKENSAARVAFSKFDDLVVKDFCQSVVFLGLHHLKKREESAAGDMLLGASVIRGRTDAKLYIRRASDDDERRIFFAAVRTGTPIPKTYLVFEPLTGASALGLTLDEDKKANTGLTEKRILEDIINFFSVHPDSSFDHDCYPVIVGFSDAKRRIFKKAVADGLLVKSGKGTKNSPFLYRLLPVRKEGEAA